MVVSEEECTFINYNCRQDMQRIMYFSLNFMRQIPACLNKIYCLLLEFLNFLLISTYEALSVDFKVKCPHTSDLGNFSAPVLH